MGIELPGEAAWFLNLIGVPWPNVGEDQVRVFAQHVGTFADNVDGTHQAASSTIRQMGSACSGSSYEQLVATWTRMSNSHMTQLVDACHAVADAADVAADAITAAKVVQRDGGLALDGAASALGVSAGSGFCVIPDELLGHAARLRAHADEVAGHARAFGTVIAGVSFGG